MSDGIEIQTFGADAAVEIFHVNPCDPVAATLHLTSERCERIDVAADGRAYDADVHLAKWTSTMSAARSTPLAR